MNKGLRVIPIYSCIYTYHMCVRYTETNVNSNFIKLFDPFFYIGPFRDSFQFNNYENYIAELY